MAFYDYREPIEFVVNQYFEKKRFHSANTRKNGMSLSQGEAPDSFLPEIPCQIVRDGSGKAVKFIYGNVSLLQGNEECDLVVWQEELVRNSAGVVVQIITTYPNGESVTTELVRDSDGKVTDYKYS